MVSRKPLHALRLVHSPKNLPTGAPFSKTLLSKTLISKTVSSIAACSLLSANACSQVFRHPSSQQMGARQTLNREARPLFAHESDKEKFSESGTVVTSLQTPEHRSAAPAPAPDELAAQLNPDGIPQRLAPLIGYFPPALSYMPAENEAWLELNRAQQTLVLYKGNSVVKEMKVEGAISLDPGDYFLQHKQKDPLWYAPNEYFAKRQLNVPPENDRRRYRKGALGKFALFPTTTFPIHCAPVWTSDVGGVRVSESDLHSIFVMIPVGAPVVIK